MSACLPIIGSLLRTKMSPAGRSRSSGGNKYRFSRSNKRSSQSAGAVSYGLESSDRRKDSGPLSNKKPTVTATVYTRDTQSDEEMAVPLREVEGPTGR